MLNVLYAIVGFAVIYTLLLLGLTMQVAYKSRHRCRVCVRCCIIVQNSRKVKLGIKRVEARFQSI